jgi:glutathione peroxidase
MERAGERTHRTAAIYEIPLKRLSGEPDSLASFRGDVMLAVNVASRCGDTPQYAGLQSLYERYHDRGLTLLGFPCDQFGHEEPGTADEIAEFCRVNYGVTFPMFEKIEVNGERRHPLYAILSDHPDDEGIAGDLEMNFEKFLMSRAGQVIRRFRYTTRPDDPELVNAIEAALNRHVA